MSIKNRAKFTEFDIVDFYPSISRPLLDKDIEFARKYTSLDEIDLEIIMHARKTLLFDKESTWIKKSEDGSPFDVAIRYSMSVINHFV